MDYFSIQRGEMLAEMLNAVAWFDNPEKPAFVAKKDESGRWHLPDLYDVGVLSGEDDSATTWKLLAALNNVCEGIELGEALAIARAILGRPGMAAIDYTAAEDVAASYRRLDGMVQAQARIILRLIALIPNKAGLPKDDQKTIAMSKKASQQIIRWEAGSDDD